MSNFPAQVPGWRYLTEGGIETEIMYRWGHELPQFAMYPLLDDPAATGARHLDLIAAAVS